ncbi:MAG: hypothetical protein HC872_06210 [Gammaproteobacteria bacterium]|nr:hypothetical protein [Gammaproteobacteria bacterium]
MSPSLASSQHEIAGSDSRQRHQRRPDAIQQKPREHAAAENRQAQHAEHRRGVRAREALQAQDLGHVEMRATVGKRHAQDRGEDQPEPIAAQRVAQAQTEQRVARRIAQGGRTLLGSRFAQPQQADGQTHQQRQQGQQRKGHAPAEIADEPHRQARHHHRGEAGAHQHDAERKPAVPEEPQVHRAAEGDGGGADAHQADEQPQAIVGGDGTGREPQGCKRATKSSQRTKGHRAHTIAVGERTEHWCQQGGDAAVHGDAQTHGTVSPAELLVQRGEEEADRVERQR